MARSAEVRELLDRVARDEYTDDDLSRLRHMSRCVATAAPCGSAATT